MALPWNAYRSPLIVEPPAGFDLIARRWPFVDTPFRCYWDAPTESFWVQDSGFKVPVYAVHSWRYENEPPP